MLSISDGLAGQARQRPDQIAVVAGEESLSYAELDRHATAAALLFWEAGLRPGDRVATLLPNGLTAVELMFGAARAGMILCPLNPQSTAAELEYLFSEARPRMLVGVPPALDVAAEVLPADVQVIPDLAPDDPRLGYAQRRESVEMRPMAEHSRDDAPWLLVYTSGTTGRPKGALRTQRSDYLLGLMLAPEVGIGPGDVGLALLPLHHVNSIWVVTLSVCLGATCHIYAARRFQPGSMLTALERAGATFAMFVPTLLTYLADAVEAGVITGHRLRVVMTSSAPLPPPLRDRLLAALPNAKFVELYGATELGAVTLARHEAGGVTGTIGFPLPGVRVRLLGPDRRPVPPGAVGELFAESPLLMDGYFARPEETRAIVAGGGLGVGDLARQDASGRLYLVDRASDTIITSGENVYPTEVEGVLQAHPAIGLCAVVAVPDPRRGESVGAVVVCREGQRVTAAELGAHCREHLAPYKCPRTYMFARELPLGVTGKIVRRRVREAWLAGAFTAATE